MPNARDQPGSSPGTPAAAPRHLADEVGKHDPFDSPQQEAYLNLLRTHAVLSRQFATLCKAFGVSEPQFNALRIIAAAGREGVASETVGRRMVAMDPDTTRLIDRLCKAQLVERMRSEADRRCVFVRITTEGGKLLRRMNPKVSAMHREQFGRLSEEELRTLNDLLFRARQPFPVR